MAENKKPITLPEDPSTFKPSKGAFTTFQKQQGLAGAGIDPASSAFKPVTTPTPTPELDTPPNIITTDKLEKVTPVSPDFNRDELGVRITESIKQATPEGISNQAFIQGLAKFTGGQPATKEQLTLEGKTVREVVEAFGASEQFGLLAEPPVEDIVDAKVDGEIVEPPKTANQKIADLVGTIGAGLAATKAGAREDVGLTAKSQAITDAQKRVNDLFTAIQNQQILDIKEEDVIRAKPILTANIQGQLTNLSREQKLDLMLSQNEYNNSLISLQIAQGDFTRAESIVKETAQDFMDNAQFQLDALEAQGRIEADERASLQTQLDNELKLATAGYVPITQDIIDLEKLTKADIFTDPVSGKQYKRPAIVTGAAGVPTIAEQIKLEEAGLEIDPETGLIRKTSGFTVDPVTGQVSDGVITIEPGTLADRNNNPGNLRFANQAGATEGEGGFAKFATPEEGFQALINQINLDAGRGLTLGEFISKYAPPVENDTEAYKNFIATTTGFDMNQQLSEVATINNGALPRAMAEIESGTTFTGEGGLEEEFRKPILIARLGKQIYGTRISDLESQRVDDFVTSGTALGKSQEDIIDAVLGYEIDDPVNQPFADSMRTLLLQNTGDDGLAGFDMLGLARLINSGNKEQALAKAELAVLKNAKVIDAEGVISESKVKSAIEKSVNLEGFISELEKSPVGVVSGTMQNWLGKLKGEEAVSIKAQVVNLVAKMRNELLGSAVTETEERFLEPLIPTLNDTPNNFMVKLEQLRENPLLELNNYRETFGLSRLDNTTLFDKGLRLGTYGAEAPTRPTIFGEATPEAISTFREQTAGVGTQGDYRIGETVEVNGQLYRFKGNDNFELIQ